MWCAKGLPAWQQYTALFLRPFYFVMDMHEASGLFSRAMEPLAFAGRQFAKKIIRKTWTSLSASFLRILFNSSLQPCVWWASAAGGPRKPPAERSASKSSIYLVVYTRYTRLLIIAYIASPITEVNKLLSTKYQIIAPLRVVPDQDYNY